MKTVFLIASLLLSAHAAAGVYKWVDATGRVHYSDKPPATAAEKLDIATRRTDPEQVAARLATETRAAPDEPTPEEQAAEQQAAAERQAQREQNCSRARRALDSLLAATRVYEPLPGGGRRYLEQEEVDQRKADAQRDIDEWCDNSR